MLIGYCVFFSEGFFRFPNEGEYDNEPVSDAAKDLIKMCLVVDPSKRFFFLSFLLCSSSAQTNSLFLFLLDQNQHSELPAAPLDQHHLDKDHSTERSGCPANL